MAVYFVIIFQFENHRSRSAAWQGLPARPPFFGRRRREPCRTLEKCRTKTNRRKQSQKSSPPMTARREERFVHRRPRGPRGHGHHAKIHGQAVINTGRNA